MNGKCFVDTNVLLYAHEESAGAKYLQAKNLIEELWNDSRGVLSTQVLQELIVNLQKKTTRRPSADLLRTVIEDLMRWEVVTNGPHACLRALDVQNRFGVSFWDAMIVQAAQAGGATILYSEDLSHGQAYGSIRVVNPFV